MEDVLALLIPIIAIVFSLSIPIFGMYFKYKSALARRKERMLAIEKGVEIPPDPQISDQEHSTPHSTPLDTLRRALILLGVGIALTIFSYIADKYTGWIMGGGLIFSFIGIALLIWFFIARKYKNMEE